MELTDPDRGGPPAGRAPSAEVHVGTRAPLDPGDVPIEDGVDPPTPIRPTSADGNPAAAAEVEPPAAAEVDLDDLVAESDELETPVDGPPEPRGDSLIRIPIHGGSAAAPVAEGSGTEWERLPNGRWVIGDPGSQLTFVAKPSNKVQARADLSVDWAVHGAVEYRAASIRGLAHFEDGKPRQDSCSVLFTQDRNWLVGCVADGVSAGTLSHAAADLACEFIPRHIIASLSGLDPYPTPESWPDLVHGLDWQSSVDAATRAIVDKAMPTFEQKYRRDGDAAALDRLRSEGPSYRDVAQLMATTAVAFIVGARSVAADGSVPFAVLVAAGDSSAMILSERSWHPITDVKNAGAEVASSAVHPLPREVRVRPCAGWLEPGQALAVFTDGIGDPLGSGRGVVGRFLAERWSTAPDPLAFASDLAFYRRTFVDDRTAALVWVRAAQG